MGALRLTQPGRRLCRRRFVTGAPQRTMRSRSASSPAHHPGYAYHFTAPKGSPNNATPTRGCIDAYPSMPFTFLPRCVTTVGCSAPPLSFNAKTILRPAPLPALPEA